jgi:pimeloyl-ACP methyl ester carboxylesterase
MPRWSPDGRRLAFFVRRPGPAETATIAVMDVATRHVRRLVERSGVSELGWTPDGRRIVFSAQGRLATVGLDGRGVRPYAAGGCPTFSPSQPLVVVCRQGSIGPAATRIELLDARGRVVRTLFRSADYATPGGFSRDGHSLVVSAGPAGQSDVYLIDVASGRSRLLLRRPGSQDVEGWLPGGSMVLADTDGITGRTTWRLLDPRSRRTRPLAGFHDVGDPVDWWAPGRPRAAGAPLALGRTSRMSHVLVHGRALYYRCTGRGAPAVLLDSGLGVASGTWLAVQRLVARHARVCRYDRAGNGLSDPAPPPRDSRHAVADVLAVIRAARLRAPIVAVGASFGGLDMQLLAATHRRLVAGLVLVDSLHPELDRRIERVLSPAQRQARRADLERNTEGIRFRDILRSEAQVRRAWGRARTRIPIVALRHGLPFEAEPGFPLRRVEALWRRLQVELAARSVHGRVVVARHSHHRIAETQPGLVAAAIRRVRGAAR